MSKDNNDIKIYTAEDIAKYWDGKMSAPEMHALEAAAMDDPFLADALEGYSNITPAAVAPDVEELRTRLLERSKDAKVVPFNNNKWWRVAAILIFLLGASLLSYKLLMQNNSNQLAKQENKTSATEDNTAATAPALKADTLTGSVSAPQTLYDSLKDVSFATKESAEKARLNTEVSALEEKYAAERESINQQGNRSVVVTTPPASVPDLRRYKKEDSFLRDDESDKNLFAKDSAIVASNQSSKPDNALQGRAAGIQIQNQQNRALDADANNRLFANNFSGRVVDDRNNAVPYASIRVNNSNQAASTNNDGYFQIKSPDTVLDLSVTSAGYQARNFSLRSNQPVQEVVLEPYKGKLSEVVITKVPEKKSKSSGKPVVYDAQPVVGWNAYNKYLDSSKTVNDANKGLTGQVIVSFIVNKQGALSDFAIVQSLSKWHNAEAIRLVKEGPAWQLLRGRKARVNVSVNF